MEKQLNFQKGTKGGGSSRSYTLKVRGPANAEGDTRNRTESINIRCDKDLNDPKVRASSKNSLCARTKKLTEDAEKLASKEYIADEQRSDKKPKRKKPDDTPF